MLPFLGFLTVIAFGAEWLAWLALSPAFMALLIFREDPEEPLPRSIDVTRLRRLEGCGEAAVWRLDTERRALFFRRRGSCWRRGGDLWGCIRFSKDGRPEVRWVPCPFVSVILFLFAAGVVGFPRAPAALFVFWVAATVVAIPYFVARAALKKIVLAELRAQIEARLPP